MKFSTRDLCFCAIGAALIAVCAWISIPAEVPFTLQTFAIFAVCGLLGGRRGTVSVLVYLLLGAVGAPVFAGFRGGFASLLGTTGGSTLSFNIFVISAMLFLICITNLFDSLTFLLYSHLSDTFPFCSICLAA